MDIRRTREGNARPFSTRTVHATSDALAQLRHDVARPASLRGLGLLARRQGARAPVAASARSLGAHDGQRGRRPARLRQVLRRLRQGRTTAAAFAAVPGAALAATLAVPAPTAHTLTPSLAPPSPLPPPPRTLSTPPVLSPRHASTPHPGVRSSSSARRRARSAARRRTSSTASR